MNAIKKFFGLALSILAAGGLVISAAAQDATGWQIAPEVQVDGAGIFLNQLVVPPAANPATPHLRLASAPSLGQTASFSRKQIIELAQEHGYQFATTNWIGANQVKVSRRVRLFGDSDLVELLTSTLQKEFVKDRGELEIHLTRPWTKVSVPDEPLTLKVSGLPPIGIMSSLLVTCELWCGGEHVGDWQVSVQASIWRDVPVARSMVPRGTLLKEADIAMERRDALVQRDVFQNFPTGDETLELSESLQPGMTLANHDVRERPVILRGHLVEGVYQDGGLSITLKVETLEDGTVGQVVRVRNPRTKRELFGKVQNEQTILITL